MSRWPDALGFYMAKYLGYDLPMTRVTTGELRNRASKLIRRGAGGEFIVILNRRRAVAKIVPMEPPMLNPGSLVGATGGTATIRGDIQSPITAPGRWFRTLV